MNIIIYSFLFFLLCFIGIGLLSTIKRKKSTVDYHVASRNASPWLVGISIFATQTSGFVFIGMIGFTYKVGLSSMWVLVGVWISYIFFFSFAFKRIRKITSEKNFLSLGEFISGGTGKKYKLLQYLIGILFIVFLSVYSAAQLTSGGKALNVLFNWNYNSGAILGSIVVLIYCFAGGIRASIWTDTAQAIVMLFAMGTLMFVGLSEVGGIKELWNKLQAIDPNLTSILPINNSFGPLLYILGWVTFSLATLGQPQIISRVISLNDHRKTKHASIYFYFFAIIFYTIVICVGLLARVLLPEISSFDSELALPSLATQLLPNVLVGLILAGIFAATMSTADSIILSCSASVTQDIMPKFRDSYLITKVSTIGIILLVLAIALFGDKNVFSLVILSYSLLGVAFAPIVLTYIFKQKPSQMLTLIMMFGGIATLLYWINNGYNQEVNGTLPGIVLSLLIFLIAKLFIKQKK